MNVEQEFSMNMYEEYEYQSNLCNDISFNDISLNTIIENDADFFDSSSLSMYLNDIADYPVLTAQEEQELFKKIRLGDTQARNKLILCNLKLVVYAVKPIAKKNGIKGTELLDLIQEGNKNLMLCIDYYSIEKGHRFSTYAYKVIQQNLQRHLSYNMMFHAPADFRKNIKQISNYIEKFIKENEIEPTQADIMRDLKFTKQKLVNILQCNEKIMSLDALYLGKDEDGEPLINILADKKNDIEELISNLMYDDIWKEAENYLTPKEIEICKIRVGKEGEDVPSLQKVGDKFGLTKERVRQIEKIGFSKMKAKCIKSYMKYGI